MSDLQDALEWADDIIAVTAQDEYEPMVIYVERIINAAKKYANPGREDRQLQREIDQESFDRAVGVPAPKPQPKTNPLEVPAPKSSSSDVGRGGLAE